jgi:hypothetical protein
MSNAQQQPDGAQTFIHGTVINVLFGIDQPKRTGGSYKAVVLNYMDRQNQAKQQAWAVQVIDNPMNAAMRAKLVELYGKPGAPFTLHKTKQGQYWNVDRIDDGHVQGVRSSAQQQGAPAPQGVPQGYAAPVAAAPQYQQPQAQGGGNNGRHEFQRSKEQCMRGEAIQAACTAEIALVTHRGSAYQFDLKRVLTNAEVLLNYINNGLAAPVTAPAPQAAAPVAAPQPAPAPVQPPPAPVYQQPTAPPTPAPVQAYAPAPAPAPAPAAPMPMAPAPTVAPPGAAPVAATPQGYDDGFGGPQQ